MIENIKVVFKYVINDIVLLNVNTALYRAIVDVITLLLWSTIGVHH